MMICLVGAVICVLIWIGFSVRVGEKVADWNENKCEKRLDSLGADLEEKCQKRLDDLNKEWQKKSDTLDKGFQMF